MKVKNLQKENVHILEWIENMCIYAKSRVIFYIMCW